MSIREPAGSAASCQPIGCRTLPDPQAIQFWMGPNAHLLHYAIGGNGGAVNFLAVVEGPLVWPHADKWQAEVEPDAALAAFTGWHPAVTEMVWGHLRGIVAGGCFLRSRCCGGIAAASCCWAMPPMPCCRITARARTQRSRMPLPLRNFSSVRRGRIWIASWSAIVCCGGRARGRYSAVPGRQILCCTCPTARPLRTATFDYRAFRKNSAQFMSLMPCRRHGPPDCLG